ncbi:excalibur calcium-binding domain-containing protein [Vibrio splendidus]|uniref:excalibur calcium-binding domain-containing protein n=1 Tax=Vibrio splendidus TaxID=29497 RepID=UPI001E2DCD8E|nr:excalibur calcium-binding domain-containing protein [Vibrio splendidus]MCC4789072.1 excalibur calcium-binding domain-containing protein [Vibrio splendidus]
MIRIVRNLIYVTALLVSFSSLGNEMWRGLVVAEEHRCSPYDKDAQYPYPASVEHAIVESMEGHIYGPYTGIYYQSTSETDIEHIVAASEGHDSGLCSASTETRKAFATDLLNLTLASPAVNRCSATGKCGLDAGEWLPPRNQCWFAQRVIQIKTKYGLSVNPVEVNTLESVIQNCQSFEMVFYPPAGSTPSEYISQTTGDALSMYDDNNNGRITCAEARNHGIAPVRAHHPAYAFMSDRDGDGIVCE